ncbi:MAG: sugar-transfer associated ATP-grasp domain-containing protein [Actinomycetota bacterium]
MTRWASVVGMNRRNAIVHQHNDSRSIHLVNDKIATKELLAEHGVAVVPTVAVLRDRLDLRQLRACELPDEWVAKPARGAGGCGIIVLVGRDGDGWLDTGGRHVSRREVGEHLAEVLSGQHSGRSADEAIIEPRLSPAPELTELGAIGLPDLRVLHVGEQDPLVMLRLPTERSGGRANLHQGGVGLAIDPRRGRVVRAVCGRHEILDHPDTGRRLVGERVPEIGRVVETAAAAVAITGLGFAGVDVVIDDRRRVMVLEVNARPGLQIQQVCDTPLLSGRRRSSWARR